MFICNTLYTFIYVSIYVCFFVFPTTTTSSSFNFLITEWNSKHYYPLKILENGITHYFYNLQIRVTLIHDLNIITKRKQICSLTNNNTLVSYPSFSLCRLFRFNPALCSISQEALEKSVVIKRDNNISLSFTTLMFTIKVSK